MLLRRLKLSGTEDRIWKTQFGFRSKYGTSDALCMIRRLMESTSESKDGQLIILALDWTKAFNSICPIALCKALSRFGIPENICHLIGDIYSNRIFRIIDASSQSEFHSQLFGISQGCPLSPFLFSILMTVLLHDCYDRLDTIPDDLRELLYADDILFIFKNPETPQHFIEIIVAEGKKYGLLLNYDKVKMLRINSDTKLFDPDGKEISCKSSIKYLGIALSENI